MTEMDPTAAVLGLDAWFDTMRVAWPTTGYGGPVIHWWNHCLAYRGTGLDWRYEGIIDGYLTLWRLSGDPRWRDKATRAGDDLVAGQDPSGHFANSRFELNPGVGGTPHEAACDVGLLLLAKQLSRAGEPGADQYLEAARRNLQSFWLTQLWHDSTSTLWDSVDSPTFVPNKAATFIEAVLLLQELTGIDELLERFAIPTGDCILALQVRRPGHELDGAIAQNRLGDQVVATYFPLYIARCIPALLQLAEITGEGRFLDGALAAAGFVARIREPDGGSPQILYDGGRRNRRPRWVAGAGDIVRALELARQYGMAVDPAATVVWILHGVRTDGRIAAAEDFDRLVPFVSRRDRTTGEMGVVGWCDKAFRALAPLVSPEHLTRGGEQMQRERPEKMGRLQGIVR